MIRMFCVEVCRSCESAGREKIYFSLNSVHKCIYGGKDSGNFGYNKSSYFVKFLHESVKMFS